MTVKPGAKGYPTRPTVGVLQDDAIFLSAHHQFPHVCWYDCPLTFPSNNPSKREHPDSETKGHQNTIHYRIFGSRIILARLYRGADKSLARPTSQCILFNGENISFDDRIVLYIYTGCPRRKGPNFGRVFLRSNYTDITQNTYIQISMVTEVLNIEK